MTEEIEAPLPSALDRRLAVVERRTVDRRERAIDLRRLSLHTAQTGRLRSSRFGHPDAESARHLYQLLDARLAAESLAGNARHQRLPWLVRQVPRLVALIDWVVLIPFCAELFNPDRIRPFTTPSAWAATLLLALMSSGITYCWLALTGRRLQVYRDDLGEIAWPATGTATRMMLGGCVVLVAALGALMYIRISDAVRLTGGQIPDRFALIVGGVFAVVGIVANLAVVAIHALDGSQLAEEHRKAGRLLRRHERLVERRRAAALRAATRPQPSPVDDDADRASEDPPHRR